MIPNKTEEQILYQFFKFYDMDGSHTCNLQNFIKANDKLGVSLSKITDIERVFNYFDRDRKGIINYKQFAHEIFNLKYQDQNPNNIPFSSNDFPNLLNEYLIKNGGNLAMINLIKNLQIVDCNNSNRLSIDDFLRVLNESNLRLSSNEIQSIFQDYELYSNGLVYYNKILDSIFEKYFDRKREIFAENLYYNLTNNGQNKISLNDIRNLYYNTPNNDQRKHLFLKFIEQYKYVTKPSIDKPISLSDMKKFIKYIGYGIESEDQLRELLYELDNANFNDIRNHNYNDYDNNKLKSSNRQIPNKYYNYDNEDNSNKIKFENIINKLRRNLIKYGRKSLFNFIKQFKHYDNNSRTISKYDFMKVLQDFNINISNSDINQLFNEYVTYQGMNYYDFLNDLSNFSMNKIRENAIKEALQFIYNKSNEQYKPIDLTFLKELYSPDNNYFIRNENENRIDFIDCLELFHYAYKGMKNENLYENEFVEFYHFISFLIENDNNFISLLKNEWKDNNDNQNKLNENKNFNFTFGRPNNENIEYSNQNNSNINYNENQNPSNLKSKNRHFNNYNNNIDNQSNYSLNQPKTNYQRPGSRNGYNYNNYNNNNLNPLEKLTQKLKGRGIRGLLYLHRQFIISCKNTKKISLNDFIFVLQSQQISFNENEYKDLFNKFSKDGLFLDFPSFIREFKKELNDNKLNCVEDAYSILDRNKNEKIPIEYIKKCYDAKNHPDVISGKKSEEEKLLEFIDCFEINFDLLNQDFNNNYVDFEIFANFYEYVAFVYDNDRNFANVLKSTFH